MYFESCTESITPVFSGIACLSVSGTMMRACARAQYEYYTSTAERKEKKREEKNPGPSAADSLAG